jgi:hypothetical protein
MIKTNMVANTFGVAEIDNSQKVAILTLEFHVIEVGPNFKTNAFY